MSVAGKRVGIKQKCTICGSIVELSDKNICSNCGAELEFTRSGLFMEQIRIIKEMREKTNECYPKIVIWENVPGALSSNNGDDFFCVLQEFCKLMGEKIPTLRPEKWSNAGEILGESCSIAWRILDAQYWGVPQRRRRIFLVANFTGTNAGEILFKPESLRRHNTPSTVPWKRFTSKVEKGNRRTDDSYIAAFPYETGGKLPFLPYNVDISPTLSANQRMTVLIDGENGAQIRKLIPLECERLQGFPDNWTYEESDSARYKALGNSVALPCVDYVMSGVADLLDVE